MSFREKLVKNLKQLAKEEVKSVDYWFRNKYKLSPKDPAYLDCEQWEIELDYLTEEAERELSKVGNFCKRCGARLEDDSSVCSFCGFTGKVEKYSDPDFDEYFDTVEKDNEGIEDNVSWEEVPDTERVSEEELEES